MTKVTLDNVANLLDATTAQTTINDNSAAIVTAVEKTLSRDGTSPNTMGAVLDMNSNSIINLPAPVSGSSPLRLTDASILNGGGTIASIPPGGTTGQVLKKNSNADYDFGYGGNVSSVNVTFPVGIDAVGGPITTSGTIAATWASGTTGSGANVFSISPALVTPNLGTPSAGVLTNTTGLPISTGVSGLGANVATFLGNPSSANLAAALTNETGTGSAVFATSPTLVTPILGTPTSGTLTNCTIPVGGVTGLGTGVSTFLGTPSSANLRGALTDETGTGSAVFATSPTITTPDIVGTTAAGNANAGSVGEYMEAILVAGSATALVNNTAKTVTSITLTAGDWDVNCYAYFVLNAATTATYNAVGLSTVTNSLDTTPGRWGQFILPGTAGLPTLAANVPPYRFNVSGSTTIFLIAQAGFAVNTCSAYGIIRARRVR